MLSFLFNSLAFLTFLFLSIFIFKNYYAWFFFFCLFCGLHLITKACLFHLDSSTYFGSLLFLLGGFGLIVHFMSLFAFAPVYYLLAFAFASLFTFLLFNQKFHLVLFIVFLGCALAWFFYKINFISLPIFIAICVALVLLFVLKYLIKNYLRRS